MLTFFKERLVFLSVPKTGSTAFESALRLRADLVVTDPPELKHMPLFRYNRFIRPMIDKVLETEMETLAVIREPVDWLGSWYRYRRRPSLKGQRNSTHDVSFDDFVLAYMQENKPGFANVGSQAKFVEPRPNGLKVNHLFKYDHQDKLVEFLERRLDVTLTLQRENASPEMELHLSDEIRAQLRQVCAAEFRIYDEAA